MKKLILVLAASSVLTGCASIMGGGDAKQVEIDSKPSGATILIEKVTQKRDDNKNISTIYSKVIDGTTPINATFSRCGMYRATVEKDGKTKQEIIDYHWNPMVLGNIIFGGGIGLIIDGVSDASCKHHNKYMIDLTTDKTNKEIRDEEMKANKQPGRND